MDENYSMAALAEACDYETKLAVTQWVMKHIVEHAQNGGSYRSLIYGRLGFEPDAYAPLCDDGLTISNEFDLTLKDRLVEALQEKDMKKMKGLLGLCDEEGCFDYITVGMPTPQGYRTICSKHHLEMVKAGNGK